MKRFLALCLAVSAVAVPSSPVRAAAQSTGRYIIRFSDSTSSTEAENTTKKDWTSSTVAGRREFKRLSRIFNGAVATLTKSETAQLKKMSNVLWVEEDAEVRTTGSTITPPSWGLDRIDQRVLPLDVEYSFANTGSGVDVYVVDTGVFAGHIQFRDRIGSLPDNAFTSVSDAFGTGDCNGHGTHVAGSAAGSTFGVAPAARIIPVRVLDCAGSGSVSGVIAGIEWALGHHTSAPAVMNLSFTTTKSVALESAVDRAFADGITVVAAAGNASTDACAISPAGAKVSALTVGATGTGDARASYSNYGSCLDLFAPGSSIVSAGHNSELSIVEMSGTSMAAPHVAGLVARFLSSNPAAAPADVMAGILADATPNVVTGAGALSPNKLAYASGIAVPTTSMTVPNTTTTVAPVTATVPGPVSNLSVVRGASSADLSWTDGNAGSLPTTSHIVRVYARGVLVDTIVVDNDSVHVIPGLTPLVSHTFSVASANGNGVGAFSAQSSAVTPLKLTATYASPAKATLDTYPPPKLTKPRIKKSGRQLVIKWQPPASVRASGFEIVIYRKLKVAARIVTAASGGVRISGLARGRYSVRVSARNAAGQGPLSLAAAVSL